MTKISQHSKRSLQGNVLSRNFDLALRLRLHSSHLLLAFQSSNWTESPIYAINKITVTGDWKDSDSMEHPAVGFCCYDDVTLTYPGAQSKVLVKLFQCLVGKNQPSNPIVRVPFGCVQYKYWGSIICKHTAWWLYLSRMKNASFCSNKIIFEQPKNAAG